MTNSRPELLNLAKRCGRRGNRLAGLVPALQQWLARQ